MESVRASLVIPFDKKIETRPTFVIKSLAAGETFSGILRSTFAIRLYVAGRYKQNQSEFFETYKPELMYTNRCDRSALRTAVHRTEIHM